MSHSRTHAQIEAEKQAASGLAKMGLVDPSLRKKEHGPKAVAKKAQRFYNSVVHGVADKKVEQQETSNMTQSFVSVLTPSTRVVSISRCRGWSLLRFRAVTDHVGAVVAARRRERSRCDGVFEAAPPRWRQRDGTPPRRRRRDHTRVYAPSTRLVVT